MIRLPQQQTKKWVTSYKGDYLGNINDNMSIDLFGSPGKVKLGGKMYPHTTGTVSGTAMTPVSSFITAKINDGAARVVKTWGVADSKMIIRSAAGVAFEKDTSTGIPSAEATGTGSDLVTYPDETEDPITVTEVSIPSGDGAVPITGTGNNTKWAQSFTQVQGPFKKFSVYLSKVGTPTDNLVIQIQSDTAGAPSGTTLTSLTLDAVQYTSTATLYEYDVDDEPWTDTTVQFDLDAVYHVVFSRSGSADESNYVQVQIEYAQNDPDVDNDAEDPYTNGSLQQYNGSSWARTITYTKTDTFTADGTWTVPTGVTSATVETWGAGGSGTANVGGGGGGAYSTSSITGLTDGQLYDALVGLPLEAGDGGDSVFNGIKLLVVAGGGGGGSGNGTRAGGGGGAGGYLLKNFVPTVTSYSVTVGAGGGTAANGSNSVFGSFTATGGGAGGTAGGNGQNGGSGGGSSQSTATEGSGTPGQGYNGGDGYSTNGGGGGGGSTSIGVTSVVGQGGNGGAGLTSSITGASASYAGGGGGGYSTGGIVGAGQAGGGNGGATAAATAATANTGSGGGGGSANGADQNGKAGGSGVVIVRYLTSRITATGGTITTDGNYTIHKFTTNGTFQVTAFATSSVVAKGGLSGTNGGTGGTTAAGTGDTKYAGGDSALGTGDRGGGGGAGSTAAGTSAVTTAAGTGGAAQGGGGGGKLNTSYVYTGGLYGGGGMSVTATGYSGARGEVRISYSVTATADYANVSQRFFGTSTSGTSHSIVFPPAILPGELLILVISADNSSTASKTGWTVLASKVATSNNCTQTILWKRATGDDDGIFTLSASTSISYVGFRIINGGTPTATQATDTTMDAPEHDAYETAKYLWLAVGTMVSSTQPNGNPTAAPSSYTSFVIQPEKLNIDEQATKGARTAVAERQREIDAENPGAFTGAGDGYAVGGTIAVPYEAQSYFIDASFALQVEFPASYERLYLTTTKDVKF